MTFRKLKRKVHAKGNKSNGDETKSLIQNRPPQIKIMDVLKATEKVKKESKNTALQSSLFAKQGGRISSLIRKQIGVTNSKVGFISPAALRFLGPGDC